MNVSNSNSFFNDDTDYKNVNNLKPNADGLKIYDHIFKNRFDMFANNPYLINKITEITIMWGSQITVIEKFTNLRTLKIYDRVIIGDNEIKHLT